MKISVKVPRSRKISEFGHRDTIEFDVESSEHDSSRECFNEIAGTVKAINADAYKIFRGALEDLTE